MSNTELLIYISSGFTWGTLFFVIGVIVGRKR